jgi:hypothetical protein
MDFDVDPRVTVLNTNPDNVTVETINEAAAEIEATRKDFRYLLVEVSCGPPDVLPLPEREACLSLPSHRPSLWV